MPTEIQRWFSLLRIIASNLGGVRIAEQYLDVGFTWSLFFAQSAHEAICEQHSGLKAVGRITDFAPGRRLKVGGMCHLEYVDNFVGEVMRNPL